jgi:hypothetical protein
MIFVFRSAGYLTLLLFFWFGVGRTFSRWLGANSKANVSGHALNGFAIVTLVASLGYRWGVPLRWSFSLFASLALLGFVLQFRHGARAFRLVFARTDSLLLLLGALVLFAPIATGGLQFSFFHSNQYDALNYMQSALARLTCTYREISAAGPAEFRQNPLLIVAHHLVSARPANVDSFALTDALSAGNLYFLGPTFLCGVMALAIPVMAGLAERLNIPPLWAGLVGIATIGGFWGQYIVDCDAWSLIAALPLALTVFRTLGEILDPTATERPPFLGLAVPSAALLLIYPEEFTFLAPAVAFSAFIFWRINRLPGANRTLLLAFVGTLVLVSPGGPDLWSFIQGQVQSSTHADHSTLAWAWTLFFGVAPQTAPIWLTAWRLCGSMVGIYFPWFNNARIGSFDPGFVFAGLLGFCVITAAISVACRAFHQTSSRQRAAHLLIFTSILLVQTLAVGLLLGAWPAAKALSYVFPWVMLLAFLPLTAASTQPRRRWPAITLLGLQMALLVYRPIIATGNNGIGYPEPFPNGDFSLKAYRRWDVDDAPRLIGQTSRVLIDVPDIWLEYYAMICLQAQGRSFVKTAPMHEYYDMTPNNFGTQDVSVKTDGLVFTEFDRHANAFSLGFSKDNEIAWSGHRPFTITKISGPAHLESWQGLLSWWNSARMEVQADSTGPAVLELLMRRPPTEIGSGRPVVTINVNRQSTQTVEVSQSQPGVMQGAVIRLNLHAGGNIISIQIDSPNGGPVVGFSNPRIILPLHENKSRSH